MMIFITIILATARFIILYYCFVWRRIKVLREEAAVAVRVQETTEIVKFPVKRIENFVKETGIDKETIICPICCDEIKRCQNLVYLPCNVQHVYHPTCIKMWLSKHDYCPLCKTELFDVLS